MAERATAETVDDMVDAWHDGDSGLPLWEYLGWTEAEYSRWVETSKAPEEADEPDGRLVCGSRAAVAAIHAHDNRPGLIEHICGNLAGRLIVIAAKRAHARGDLHEFDHLHAAIKVGNTGRGSHAGGCVLPLLADIDPDWETYRA